MKLGKILRSVGPNYKNITVEGICFNSVNTIIGDYLEKYRQFNFEIAGSLKEDNYNHNSLPQIIIKDLMLLN